MGSFANSMHVQCNDAADVIDAIENALHDTGYETTDEQPDEDEIYMPSPLRAFHVIHADNGWVGVLDSDLVHSAELASDLSGRLKTHALQFMVHDSDTWTYVLYRQGSQVDAFNSLAGGHEAGEMTQEMARLLLGGGIEQRMRDAKQRMEDEMPPEIREIITRAEATPEELQQVADWIQAKSHQVMGQLMPGMVRPENGPSVPESKLRAHAERLRPILPIAATERRVIEVLGTQAVFAETTLEEFMKLIGIQPSFASLSYPYLAELSRADLLDARITLAAHLKYKTDAFAI